MQEEIRGKGSIPKKAGELQENGKETEKKKVRKKTQEEEGGRTEKTSDRTQP